MERVDAVVIGSGVVGMMRSAALTAAVANLAPGTTERICAIVATSGTTNAGAVDDLDGIADVCAEFGLWNQVLLALADSGRPARVAAGLGGPRRSTGSTG